MAGDPWFSNLSSSSLKDRCTSNYQKKTTQKLSINLSIELKSYRIFEQAETKDVVYFAL